MARPIGDKKFLETLELSCSIAGRLGEQIISRDKNSYECDRKSYVNNIKKEATAYKESVKAIKEIDGIRKLVPSGKSRLLDMAIGNAKSTVERVSGYKTMLLSLTERVKEVTENEKDMKESKENWASEPIAIKKLLKSGFISEFRYEPGIGMSWKYPPMIYKENDKVFFLGYPQAGLSETNVNGFILKLPSYNADGIIGTAHMVHSDKGDNYCLGGYDDLVKILAAKRQISSLIRIFRDYFQSFNGKSRHNNPDHLTMDINLPKVTDDSWEVWKKQNHKFKMPEPAVMIEMVECSGCGDVLPKTALDSDWNCAACR